jgi:hypothetical protein
MEDNVDGFQIGVAWRGTRLSAVPTKVQHLRSSGQHLERARQLD